MSNETGPYGPRDGAIVLDPAPGDHPHHLGTFYDVHSELGSGFLESVYANALTVALIGSTLRVERQVRFEVDFRGVSVGRYVADSWSNPRSWWRRKQRARSTRCTGHSCSITCEPPASRSASS